MAAWHGLDLCWESPTSSQMGNAVTSRRWPWIDGRVSHWYFFECLVAFLGVGEGCYSNEQNIIFRKVSLFVWGNLHRPAFIGQSHPQVPAKGLTKIPAVFCLLLHIFLILRIGVGVANSKSRNDVMRNQADDSFWWPSEWWSGYGGWDWGTCRGSSENDNWQ